MRRAAIVVWSVALAGLLAANVATAQRIDFADDHLVGWVPLIPNISIIPSVPLLDHFHLGYERDDHHVLGAVVFPPTERRFGYVGLWDSSLSRFHYDVGWRLLVTQNTLPPAISLVSGDCGGRRCTVQVDDHPFSAGGTFVLLGFHLKFENGDHHIDVIEVREQNQEIVVEFADKNGDDPFEWDVEFTYLPADRVHTTATVRGTAAGWDSKSTGLSPDVVIGGFRFDFDDNDHHIRDFAIDVRDGHTVSVKYNDENSDDDYDWIVDLVELN
ncbi:MAG: hypothetical protein AAGD06_28360 [Acidobacteriota bacterium]